MKITSPMARVLSRVARGRSPIPDGLAYASWARESRALRELQAERLVASEGSCHGLTPAGVLRLSEYLRERKPHR